MRWSLRANVASSLVLVIETADDWGMETVERARRDGGVGRRAGKVGYDVPDDPALLAVHSGGGLPVIKPRTRAMHGESLFPLRTGRRGIHEPLMRAQTHRQAGE